MMGFHPFEKEVKVSVLMPVFNGSLYIVEAINSVLNQTFKDFELIIVNDGSTDDTIKKINLFDDPRIKLIDRSENLGLTKTRNEAISFSTGNYIAMLDSDDIAYSTRLEEQVLFLDNNPEYSLVGSWVETIDDKGKTINKCWRFECNPNRIKVCLLFHNTFAQSTVMLRRTILPEGPYREGFPPAEDYDLWVRIASKYRVANLPRVLVKYREHHLGISTTRADLREGSVLRNVAQQLEVLGVTFDEENLILHRLISTRGNADSLDGLKNVEAWLLRIREANLDKSIYCQDTLNEVIRKKWYDFCSSSSTLGMGCYKYYRYSQIKLKNYLYLNLIRLFIRCFFRKR